ncbi:MAG: hypothetical protein ACI3ZS_02230 [Candidatus Cryptobacteroides sp.]
MSRKSLIICLCVLLLLIGGISIAVALLYSGGPMTKNKAAARMADDSRYLLLPAIPSDAVAVFCFSDASDAWQLTPFCSFDCRMAVSFHYSGKLVPLYVFDAGKASEERSTLAESLIETAAGLGMTTEYLDCSKVAGKDKKLSGRSIVLASESEVILRSAVRHIEKNVSVLDLDGFTEAAGCVSGQDVMIISNSQSSRLVSALLTKSFSPWSDFASRLASWTSADIDNIGPGGITLTGRTVHDNGMAEFMTVMENITPSNTTFAKVLPSFTFSALSLPMKDMDSYVSSYKSFMDSKQKLQDMNAKQKSLAASAGVSPADYFAGIGIQEAATASFVVGSTLERVNLVRTSSPSAEILFKGTGISSLKDYTPGVHPYAYKGFLASMFGSIFSLPDESCFTFVDGWVVSGSSAAIAEYANGHALDYTLREYLADAGKADLLGSKPVSVSAYLSVSSAVSSPRDMFKPAFTSLMAPLTQECDLCPAVLTMGVGKDKSAFRIEIKNLTLKKSKAPAFEHDTTVVIPQGPFRVKNSGTGKMNLFYQQDNLYLCLKEEGGKGLWGVPFDRKICGTASNIDYFANGKLQFLFGAGSKIYLIDRLGRFVSGFPVELGKEILVGPSVYDFNSTRKYNIMVLHKDNTVEMYNLKGQKPSSWLGIKAEETIKALPDRVVVGDKSCWVVRTSIRTLIFPFNGGDPLNNEKADKMARPDTEVRVVDGAVEYDCYDGKTRKLVL